jgi:hypothetical protein
MAIYHVSAQPISRADGRSSVEAAAYRSGELIVDDRTGEVHDFRRKRGIVFKKVILPGGGTMARAELWNKIEMHHKRGDAIVAREFECALPFELNALQRSLLAEKYSTYLSDKYEVAVDLNIHKPHKKRSGDGDERNHHAHIEVSACHVFTDGSLGKKCVELDPIHCARAKIKNAMEVEREVWQDMVNKALECAGSNSRIDHRTLEAQGILDRAPGVHLGPAASGLAKRGRESDLAKRAKIQADRFMARKVQEALDAKAKEFITREVERIEIELASARAELKAEHVEPVDHLLAYAAAQLQIKDVQFKRVVEVESKLAKIKTDLTKIKSELLKFETSYLPVARPQFDIDRAKADLPLAKTEAEELAKIAEKLEHEQRGLSVLQVFRKSELKNLVPAARANADGSTKRVEQLSKLTKVRAIEFVNKTLKDLREKRDSLLALAKPLQLIMDFVNSERKRRPEYQVIRKAQTNLDQLVKWIAANDRATERVRDPSLRLRPEDQSILVAMQKTMAKTTPEKMKKLLEAEIDAARKIMDDALAKPWPTISTLATETPIEYPIEPHRLTTAWPRY